MRCKNVYNRFHFDILISSIYININFYFVPNLTFIMTSRTSKYQRIMKRQLLLNIEKPQLVPQ